METVAWYLGLLLLAAGCAMTVRWSFTRTQDPTARAKGVIRGSVVALVGIGLTLATIRSQTGLALVGVPVAVVIGMAMGVIGAKALEIPR